MASEALKKFADELRFSRESKSITLQQIASKTKIDLKFLQEIEEANFDVLPDIYIRAFIKEYAQIIDLNSKEILQKYEEAKSGKLEVKLSNEERQIESTTEKEFQEKINLPTEPEPKQKLKREFSTVETQTAPADLTEVKTVNGTKINYIVGAVILVIALFIIYFAFLSGSSPEIIQEKLEQDAVSTNGERFAIEKQTPKQDLSEIQDSIIAPPLPIDSLHLTVLTTEQVWVKVSADGKILHQKIVPADTRMNYTAKKNFSVSVGNAGRVKVYLNNKPVENVGKPGEIRNLFITADGIKYYTILPKKNEDKSPAKN